MTGRLDSAYAGVNRTLLLLTVIAVGIFFIAMPRYMDDFWYMIDLKPWLEGLSDTSLWPALVETWTDRLESDNARMANIVFVPFLMLPKWIGSVIAAVMWGVCMVWSLRICRVDVFRSPLTAVAVFLWTFCLPWYDTMGAQNYQFNYFFSLFFALLAIKLFLNIDKKTNRWLLLFLGFFIGSWHEGFTVPLLCAFFALLVILRRYRTTDNKFLFAGLFAGIIWLVSWPCAWNRTEYVLAVNDYGFSHLLFIAAQHPAVFLTAICCAVPLVKPTWRPVFKDPVVVLLLINVVVSFLIHFFTLRSPRAGFWAEACAVMLVICFLRHFWPVFATAYSLRRFLYLSPFILIVLVHWTLVDCYSVRIRHSFDLAVNEWKCGSQPHVFTEVLDEHSAPLICMFAPDFTTMLAPVSLAFADVYLDNGDGRQFIPVPQELRDYAPSYADALPSGPLGIKVYKGRMVMPTDSVRRGEFLADVDFGYKVRRNVRMIYYPFVSEADSMRYAFVYPWRSVIEMRLGKIKSVTPVTIR